MRRFLTALAGVGLAVSAWFTADALVEPVAEVVVAEPGLYCC